jgi:tellurium resistance protein TerD
VNVSFASHILHTQQGIRGLRQAKPPYRNGGSRVSLAKGGNVSLNKQASNLTEITLGLGWSQRATEGDEYDLDASALMLGPDNKVLSDKHFVFYGNDKSPDGSVVYGGDERAGGSGDQDDETIDINLTLIPAEGSSVVFPVSIYDADKLGQSFGQVRAAYIRVVNAKDGLELARYDLAEDASTETAMVFGQLYRRDGEWKFRAIGQGYTTGLRGIARDYGVNVE